MSRTCNSSGSTRFGKANIILSTYLFLACMHRITIFFIKCAEHSYCFTPLAGMLLINQNKYFF
jgi:hypothetical protein